LASWFETREFALLTTRVCPHPEERPFGRVSMDEAMGLEAAATVSLLLSHLVVI
jgi:hypothetical protein